MYTTIVKSANVNSLMIHKFENQFIHQYLIIHNDDEFYFSHPYEDEFINVRGIRDFRRDSIPNDVDLSIESWQVFSCDSIDTVLKHHSKLFKNVNS